MSILHTLLRAVGVFLVVFVVSQPVSAQEAQKPAGSGEHSNIGVGLIVSGEVGANVKYFITRNLAIDATLGGNIWSFRGRTRGLHIDTDFQYHLTDLVKVSKGELDFYAGAGIGFNRWALGIGPFNTSFITGELRIPVGAEYYYVFEPFPMGFFGEIVPKMAFGDVAGSVFWNGTLNLGARIHF